MSHHSEPQPATTEASAAANNDQETSNTSIPLAPLTGDAVPPATATDLRNEALRLDVVLALLVIVLAGLLASFPVRNSDFWMHLATGRRILAGEANFGVDPYSYTTAGVYWANAAWGFDVLFYGLTRLGGGLEEAMAGYLVVGAKALLTALLALVMLLTCRRTESLWAPAVCTLLGLLAMSFRLILQPTVISALFLAITIFILQLPRHEESARGPRPKSRIYWLLPVLFLVWANVDEWFVLGPATIILFLLGQGLQQFFAPLRTGEDAPEPGQFGKLALVLVVGLAACLINPYHIHVFAIPREFAPNLPTELIRTDSFFRSFQISMFDTKAFSQSAGEVSMISAYLLVILGIASFVLTFLINGWRWWRLLIWGAFFFLGAYQARLMLFFAVGAAPITALNLQDFARSQHGSEERFNRLWKIWSIGGRLVSCLACIVFMLLAWPGWLHGTLLDGRRQHQVGLKIEPDDSLVAAARQLALWQKSGQIPADAHMFNWVPDLPGYFSWYQPGLEIGKGFLDYRFGLFPKNVFKDYLEIRRAIKEGSERNATSNDLTELFRKHKIQYLALNWADPIGLELLTVMREWIQWKLLFMEGNTVIVQRLDSPDSSEPGRPSRLHADLVAFGTPTISAPNVGPGRGPRLQEVWQLYLDGPPIRPQQTLSAFEFIAYFDTVRKQWPLQYIAATDPATWSGLAAASACSPVVATGAASLNLIFSSLRVLVVLTGQAPLEVFTQGADAGPPGALLLAIRYGRQALAAEPDHFQAYNQLGAAYNYIGRMLEDRWAPNSPNQTMPRQVLRRVQITTVLEQVLRVRPADVEAHRVLMGIYEQLKFLDLAQEHRRFVADRVASAGPESGETMEAYRKRMENMEKQLQGLDDDLNKRRNAFELAAQNRPLFDKARVAVGHGLGRQALEIMMESDLTALSEQEMRFVLELLLNQGQAEEVERDLGEESRVRLGLSYDWYKAQAGAALGNYDDAFKALENAADQLENAAGQMALQLSVSQTFYGENLNNVNGQRSLVEVRRQQADFLVLAGMIALEQGNNAQARATFEKALTISANAEFNFESKPIAKRYLQLLDKAAAASRK